MSRPQHQMHSDAAHRAITAELVRLTLTARPGRHRLELLAAQAVYDRKTRRIRRNR